MKSRRRRYKNLTLYGNNNWTTNDQMAILKLAIAINTNHSAQNANANSKTHDINNVKRKCKKQQ